MIKLFDYTDSVFNVSNGDMIITATKCKVIKGDLAAGEYYVDLETPIRYVDVLIQDKIVVVPTKWGEQPFRLNNPEKKGDKLVFKAYHIFYDTKNYVLQDVYPKKLSCQDSLKWIIARTDTENKFIAYSDLPGTKTARYVNKSLFAAICEMAIEWGGIIDVDGMTIKLVSQVGKDRGTTIRYSKNLINISAKEDWSSVCTKLYAVGYNGVQLDEPLVSQYKYGRPYSRAVEFTPSIEIDINDTESVKSDLKKQAQEYIENNQIPKVSYTIKSNVDNVVEVGDIIQVQHEHLGIDILTKVVKYVYNVLTEQFDEIVIGNFRQSLKTVFTELSEQVQEVKITNSKKYDALKTELEESKTIINKFLSYGYRYETESAIYYMDATTPDEATLFMIQSLGGIGFGEKEKGTAITEAEYTSAWTLDGKFNADFITVGQMQAERIDIDSLFEVINSDEIHTLKSSKILLDGEGQTLDVSFENIIALADTAISDASNAHATAVSALDTANEVAAIQSEQTTEISVIQGQINTKIWQQDIDSTIGKMNIGAKNLIREMYIVNFQGQTNKSQYISSGTITHTSAHVHGGFKFDSILCYEPNTEYVLSGYVTVTTGSVGNFYIYNGKKHVFKSFSIDGVKSGSPLDSGVTAFNTILDDGKKHYFELHFITASSIPVDSDANYTYFQLGKYFDSEIAYTISGLKLEKGNKATDWSPAPEDVQGEITTLSTRYNELEMDVTGFKVTVAAEYVSTEEYAKLSIGGRNLFRDTKKMVTENKWISISSSATITDDEQGYCIVTLPADNVWDNINFYFQDSIEDMSGKQVTLSFDAMSDGLTTPATQWTVQASAMDDSNFRYATLRIGYLGDAIFNTKDYANGVWTRVKATFILPSISEMGISDASITPTRYAIQIFSSNTNDKNPIQIRKVKCEYGNKATDWTPAPEDVSTEIYNAVDNVNVGGRNLIQKKNLVNFQGVLETENFVTAGEVSHYSDTIYGGFRFDSVDIYEPSTDYVLHGHITVLSGTVENFCILNRKNHTFVSFTVDGVKYSNPLGYMITDINELLNDGNRHYFELHFTTNSTIPDDTGTYYSFFYLNRTLTTTVKYKITGFKLEKGNKATDWSPSPEDVEADIVSVKTIATQNAEKFNWLVSGESETSFTLTDRMAELTTQLVSLNADVQISGDMIVDGAITATKIAIGDFTNLAMTNPDSYNPYSHTIMEDASGVKWFQFGSDTKLGYYTIYMNTMSNQATFKKGDKYLFRGLVRASQTTSVRVCLRAVYTDSGYINMASAFYDNVTTEAQYVEIPFEVVSLPAKPVKCYRLFLETRNTKLGILYARELSVHQMTGNVLIADGAITSDKISVKAITADKIDVNDLFAQEITATGSITGAKLIGSEVEGGKIILTDNEDIEDPFFKVICVDDALKYVNITSDKIHMFNGRIEYDCVQLSPYLLIFGDYFYPDKVDISEGGIELVHRASLTSARWPSAHNVLCLYKPGGGGIVLSTPAKGYSNAYSFLGIEGTQYTSNGIKGVNNFRIEANLTANAVQTSAGANLDTVKHLIEQDSVAVLEITESGEYYILNATDAPTKWGFLKVMVRQSNANYRKLIWSPHSSNIVYVNTYNNGTWTGWTQL